MWTGTTFNLIRREITTSRPFDEVIAAIEDRAPLVVPEFNGWLLGRDTLEALAAQRIDSAELRRRIEARVGSSGMLVIMKVEHDVVLSHFGRTNRSVQYSIGNPLIAKDAFEAAPKACLYAPLRIAVLENEKDGSTSVMFDSPKSLLGSFGSDAARKIGDSLDQRMVELVEQVL